MQYKYILILTFSMQVYANAGTKITWEYNQTDNVYVNNEIKLTFDIIDIPLTIEDQNISLKGGAAISMTNDIIEITIPKDMIRINHPNIEPLPETFDALFKLIMKQIFHYVTQSIIQNKKIQNIEEDCTIILQQIFKLIPIFCKFQFLRALQLDYQKNVIISICDCIELMLTDKNIKEIFKDANFKSILACIEECKKTSNSGNFNKDMFVECIDNISQQSNNIQFKYEKSMYYSMASFTATIMSRTTSRAYRMLYPHNQIYLTENGLASLVDLLNKKNNNSNKFMKAFINLLNSLNAMYQLLPRHIELGHDVSIFNELLDSFLWSDKINDMLARYDLNKYLIAQQLISIFTNNIDEKIKMESTLSISIAFSQFKIDLIKIGNSLFSEQPEFDDEDHKIGSDKQTQTEGIFPLQHHINHIFLLIKEIIMILLLICMAILVVLVIIFCILKVYKSIIFLLKKSKLIKL